MFAFNHILNILFITFQIKSIQETTFDLSPFGKVPPVGPDPDTDDEGN